MAKTVDQLTDRTIRSLSEPGMHPDGDGLYLQVTGDGEGKSWIFRYSLRGKAREMGLGAWKNGKGVSLADARTKKRECRALLDKHIDPIDARKQERAANVQANAQNVTFKNAAETCIPVVTRELTNPKHIAQWTSTIETYAYPVLKDMYVRDITVHDIHRALEPIWSVKSETANRVRSRIERIMDWARVKGYCTGENPARLKGNLSLLLGERKEGENHPALPYAELPAFLTQLRQQNGTAARALEFLILTAARTQEVMLAEPKEINEAEKLWTAPPKHMKRRRVHLVPLCKRALDLAQTAPGQKFLFLSPDNEGSGLSDNAMAAVLDRMNEDRAKAGLPRWIDPKLNRDAVPHGFRSTFKDWAIDKTDFEDYVSEAALAHARGDKAEKAYARSKVIEKRRRLMDAWASFCDGCA